MKFHSKSIRSFMFLLLLLASFAFSETYYVKTDGNDYASGTSWQNAFQTITKAVSIAIAEDIIWVKEGTYKEGDTIFIPPGVSLYGGFAGTEISLEQRNISEHSSIIDGENSYRCVAIYLGTIDGFYVKNGYPGLSLFGCGGGIFNEKGTISNCILDSNKTDSFGGGISNIDGEVKNCTICSNESSYGGGIYNETGSVTSCTLYWNFSYICGGGIHNENGEVIDCKIYSNDSYYDNGGGIYNKNGSVNMCEIYRNYSDYNGGGIHNEYGGVNNCKIYSNGSYNNGGGIINIEGKVASSIIYSNFSYNYGGGIYNENGEVTNCAIYSNESYLGGGIFNYRGTVKNSSLDSNWTYYYGGGCLNDSGMISGCRFSSNSAGVGGGIYNYKGEVIECNLSANYGYEYGGGIYNDSGDIYNSVINFNTAGEYGGGVYNYYYSSIIYNCIISSNTNWGIRNSDGRILNSTLYNNVGIYNTGYITNSIIWESETTYNSGSISYTCFKDADGTNGNINADPMFINVEGSPSGWIYQVKNGSPCIDAGNPDAEYNDGCQPPGKGALRNDMGAYGGPYNCKWGINITKDDLIGFLTGRKILYNLQFPFADFNSDDKIDIADLLLLISH
ncbi:DUF1565 domain-containing protein [Candidatus Sumerlaeota bacterium]|nr:DUF1565 domain-containing protein [Candidatus Sumerlaeota bacterium]